MVSVPERVTAKARASARSRLPWCRRRRGLARKEPQASGGRAHGRKDAACLQGCRLAESLVECWRVPKTPFDQQVAHVANDSTLSSTPACDSTLSSKIFVGAMRMDVSSIQAPLRMRVATEKRRRQYPIDSPEPERGRGESSERRARRASFQRKWQPPWLASAWAHCKRTRVGAIRRLTFCFEYPCLLDAGGFNEPNKTVVK